MRNAFERNSRQHVETSKLDIKETEIYFDFFEANSGEFIQFRDVFVSPNCMPQHRKFECKLQCIIRLSVWFRVDLHFKRRVFRRNCFGYRGKFPAAQTKIRNILIHFSPFYIIPR